MVGQILLGLAQPFVLAAPTRYSDLWFSPRGRVAATALASLANPFGGALGQLIDPFIATKPSDIPNLTLYVAIISSVATIPSFFIPAQPPTPVAPSSLHERPTVARQVSYLLSNPTAWLICIAFSTYVGFFNSFSSLLTQILTPYDFSEEDSGLAGAVLILVGLVVAAISSPLVDKYKPYLLMIKILVPLLALSYLAFVWAPDSRSIAAPYVICAVTGATSFSLVPIALEWAVEVTWPVGPELTSVIFWAGGQMLGGVFIIISDALMAGADAEPPFNMHKALIFQAVVALAVVPLVMALGYVGSVKTRRLEVDNGESVVEG
jgi:FLVCR family MFS transporter 7